MNILITNDDGIKAEGLLSLCRVLSAEHDIFVIAPDRERSGCSNAITVRSNMQLTRTGENMYSLDGYPSDCVNVALHGTLFPEIDLVVSGINHGPNLGTDMIFSGTVGAARTAAVFGRPAIAISLDCYHSVSDYLDEASQFLLEFIREQNTKPPFIVNINYPDIPRENIRGVRYTRSGLRFYNDTCVMEQVNENEMLVSVHGNIENRELEGSDVTELENGYISITPLSLDCTDFDMLKKKGSRVPGI